MVKKGVPICSIEFAVIQIRCYFGDCVCFESFDFHLFLVVHFQVLLANRFFFSLFSFEILRIIFHSLLIIEFKGFRLIIREFSVSDTAKVIIACPSLRCRSVSGFVTCTPFSIRVLSLCIHVSRVMVFIDDSRDPKAHHGACTWWRWCNSSSPRG